MDDFFPMWSAIWSFFAFWAHCLVQGVTFGGGVFGWAEILLAFLWLYYRKKGKRKLKTKEEAVQKWAKYSFFGVLVFSTIFVAPYVQYASEKKFKEAAQKALEDKSPQLDGFIHRSMMADEPGTTNSLIFLDLSIRNYGVTPSFAEDYGMKVFLSQTSSTNAEEINFADEYKLNFFHKDKLWLVNLKRPQLISEKTTKAITLGENPRGWIAFRLRGIPTSRIRQTNVVVSFSDFNATRTLVTNQFRKGKLLETKLVDDFTVVIPGAENIFYPVEQPARTNWLPPELPPGCSNVVVFFGAHGLAVSRQLAEISSNGKKFSISELPDFFIKDLDKSPNYSPRQRDFWLKTDSSKLTIGERTVDYPIQPVVISNRLYVEVEIPFANEKRKIVMSDVFSSELPIPQDWDVNLSTNYDSFGNGIYAYEVVNELKNPVLQVVYSAPNEVHINGIFQVDSNSILAAFGEQPILGEFKLTDLDATNGLMTASLQIENFHETLIIRSNETIASFGQRFTNVFFRPIFKYQKPIFKYPSNRNLGVFADDENTAPK